MNRWSGNTTSYDISRARQSPGTSKTGKSLRKRSTSYLTRLLSYSPTFTLSSQQSSPTSLTSSLPSPQNPPFLPTPTRVVRITNTRSLRRAVRGDGPTDVSAGRQEGRGPRVERTCAFPESVKGQGGRYRPSLVQSLWCREVLPPSPVSR